jgi:enoyl-[acyl-carrier-protein] reductase (NADH)
MLSGKKLLITGIANSDSIAFAVAERAQLLGAEVALTAFPRDRESGLGDRVEGDREAEATP